MTRQRDKSARPSADARHRTTPVNLTPVPNYPNKLCIYQLGASPYWWVRYYANGKILRRSTKETDQRKAIANAKAFYDEINYKQRQGLVVNSRADFETCANEVIAAQDGKVGRGEMSEMMQQADKYRLQKELLPFFREMDLSKIDFFAIQRFIDKLGKDKLTAPTIRNYLGLLRKTLNYAQQRGLLAALPQFPKIAKSDVPRGWFPPREYRAIRSAARRMAGNVWEIRTAKAANGEERQFVCARLEAREKIRAADRTARANSRLVRAVAISHDLYELIVFMTNSFIRPTDVKTMQHKHVEVVKNEHTYLRLTIPTTKKHNKPIVTMANAVAYYQRLREHHSTAGMASREDYVFLPQYGPKDRDKALKLLQKQFSIVLAETGLEKGPLGEERSLYSLRHTCIMYRLQYGEAMDLLTLARNARTSPEMIDRFYASHLTGEMNVGMLQSRRRRRRTYAQHPEVTQPD